MQRHARWIVIFAATILLILLGGYWGIQKAKQAAHEAFIRNRLQDLGLANISYRDKVLRFEAQDGIWFVGPKSWDELFGESTYGAELAEDLPVFQDNEVIVHWGYRFRIDQLESAWRVRSAGSKDDFSSEEFILAYPKAALSEGGPVLLFYGPAPRMSADELKKKLIEQGHESLPPTE